MLLSAGRSGANACKADGSAFVKAPKKYNLNPKEKPLCEYAEWFFEIEADGISYPFAGLLLTGVLCSLRRSVRKNRTQRMTDRSEPAAVASPMGKSVCGKYLEVR